jgi:hypothetical protein
MGVRPFFFSPGLQFSLDGAGPCFNRNSNLLGGLILVGSVVSSKKSELDTPTKAVATFDYQQIGGVWQLVKITDIIGITSEFTYNGDFINSLKIPYGTSIFAKGESGTTHHAVVGGDRSAGSERTGGVSRRSPRHPILRVGRARRHHHGQHLYELSQLLYWDKKTMWLRSPTRFYPAMSARLPRSRSCNCSTHPLLRVIIQPFAALQATITTNHEGAGWQGCNNETGFKLRR